MVSFKQLTWFDRKLQSRIVQLSVPCIKCAYFCLAIRLFDLLGLVYHLSLIPIISAFKL